MSRATIFLSITAAAGVAGALAFFAVAAAFGGDCVDECTWAGNAGWLGIALLFLATPIALVGLGVALAVDGVRAMVRFARRAG